MCGINGEFHYREGVPRPQLVKRQSERMRHRGPDGEGLWHDERAALGHRRLSVVDLTPTGRQPMPNEDGSVQVVYNGEIYGGPRLRRDLENVGHRFRGTSDTEAMLHLYEQSGDAFLEELRGKFALGIYDRTRRRLVLARDRMGIKPLYYHDDGSRLAFASELTALVMDPRVPRETDLEAVLDYLAFGYVPAPKTIWKGVRKLPPGHLLVADANGVRVRPYWTIPQGPPLEDAEDALVDRLRELIEEAVRVRLHADVPMGALLSGGLDSSAVVESMTRFATDRVDTFTVGFPGSDASEIPGARRVATHLGTSHHETMVTPQAADVLPRLIAGIGEPFADASIVPTFYLSRFAAEQLKVVLSGDGGDEMLGGYRTYPAALRHARLNWIPAPMRAFVGYPARWLGADDRLATRLQRVPMNVFERHVEAMACFSLRPLERVLSPSLTDAMRDYNPFRTYLDHYREASRVAGEVPALLHLDARTFLSGDVLQKVDSASMANSLEVRCPLLDTSVVEFAARLPLAQKVRGRSTKHLLRRALAGRLPDDVLAQGKRGFSPPIESWFGGSFGSLVRELLTDPAAKARQWLDPREVERRLNRQASSGGESRRLWTLACLELWAQQQDAADVALTA